MRITAEAKESTRQKIMAAGQSLFRSAGFEATTTRDIAQAAGIATGTLFNYFPTKEALASELIMEAISKAPKSLEEAPSTLEEALFSNAASVLRKLKPYRKLLAPVLETNLSPLARTSAEDAGQQFRTAQLELVHELALPFVNASQLDAFTLQMYWTLFLGVLSFWITDKSPKQEDTLALLDQSMEMFADWLQRAKSSGK
jgi:AcrR family transcriptional regulator